MSDRLFIPGPVEVDERVLVAQAKRMQNHRGPVFHKLLGGVVPKLQEVYKTKQRVFLLTSSGTGAIEAGLVNLVEQGDKVLCIENGDFGRRLYEASSLWTDNAKLLTIPYGKGAHPEDVKKAVDEFHPDVVAFVHNDTSTGVQNPVKEICEIAQKAGAMTFVDSVSGLGGAEMRFDDWGVDVCASAAQKSVGGVPGAAFVAVSDEAWAKISARKKIPSFYFNLQKHDKFWVEKKETPYTTGVSAYYALEVALDLLLAEGVDASVARHCAAAQMVGQRLEKMGFPLFIEEGYRSSTLTVFRTDNAETIKKALLDKYGFEIGLGMKEWRGKLCRIAHMGSFSTTALEALLAALEAEKSG